MLGPKIQEPDPMWPAYVINLAANTRRMARSAAELSGAGVAFERIEAVDGRALDDAGIARVYDADANRRRARHPLVAPEIGCYLSHIAAWRRIAGAAAAGGFVFEDDVAVSGDLAGVMAALSDECGDWDMVKLFHLGTAPRTLRRRPLGKTGALGELVIPYRVPTTLLGYGLTRDAARRLAARAIPFFRPVDEDQKFFWETGLRVALVLPNPIRTGDQQADTGTVGEARRTAGRRRGRHRVLHGLAYQLRYRTALAWHRLKGDGQ
jgi:glycosyl transferase family 25